MRFLPPPKRRTSNIFLCWLLLAFPAVASPHSLQQQSSSPPRQGLLLALTSESFKLADLQFLAASIEQPTCQRLLLDAATGSSLLRVDDTDRPFPFQQQKQPPPVFLQRCQWTGVVVAWGATPEDLLEQIRHQQNNTGIVDDDDVVVDDDPRWLQHPWTLNYLCLSGDQKTTHTNRSANKNGRRRSYTATTLLCALSQAIRAPLAALDPRSDDTTCSCLDRLILLDTATGGDEQLVGPPSASNTCAFYLVKKLDVLDSVGVLQQQHSTLSSLSSSSSFRDHKKWSHRPFPYSSAVNPGIAELVLDILVHLARQQRRRQRENGKLDQTRLPIRFLDPCCGSGTFLAAALDRGIHATGYDVNEKCVQGTVDNLRYFCGSSCGDDDGSSDEPRYQVYKQDSTTFATTIQQQGRPLFDCAACNLPWDLNTKTCSETNWKILTTLRQRLKEGAPCAIVSKGTEDSPLVTNKDLEHVGLRTVGQAQVPPKNFKLPEGNKKRMKRNADSASVLLPKDKGRSHCLVTIVEAI